MTNSAQQSRWCRGSICQNYVKCCVYSSVRNKNHIRHSSLRPYLFVCQEPTSVDIAMILFMNSVQMWFLGIPSTVLQKNPSTRKIFTKPNDRRVLCGCQVGADRLFITRLTGRWPRSVLCTYFASKRQDCHLSICGRQHRDACQLLHREAEIAQLSALNLDPNRYKYFN